MYERTLSLELPLKMFEEIDKLVEDLYAGNLKSVYDDSKIPLKRVAFTYNGVTTQLSGPSGNAPEI
jgi:hypothetical protein